MKKAIFIAALASMMGLCTSCQEKSNAETSINVINDNGQPHSMPKSIFTGAADSLATAMGLENIPSSMNAILVETEGKQILFDTGNGAEHSQLLPELTKAGLSPEEIDIVFITHMHGDHIGGLMKDGKVVFTQADIYINQQEIDAWMAMPEERNAQVRNTLEAYGKQIKPFKMGDQLPHNIQAIAAYGHTEGHTVYRIGKALIAGDIMHGIALQLENPDICARFDGDHERSIAARKSIIELVKTEQLRMYGMHFPAPGYVEFE